MREIETLLHGQQAAFQEAAAAAEAESAAAVHAAVHAAEARAEAESAAAVHAAEARAEAALSEAATRITQLEDQLAVAASSLEEARAEAAANAEAADADIACLKDAFNEAREAAEASEAKRRALEEAREEAVREIAHLEGEVARLEGEIARLEGALLSARAPIHGGGNGEADEAAVNSLVSSLVADADMPSEGGDAEVEGGDAEGASEASLQPVAYVFTAQSAPEVSEQLGVSVSAGDPLTDELLAALREALQVPAAMTEDQLKQALLAQEFVERAPAPPPPSERKPPDLRRSSTRRLGESPETLLAEMTAELESTRKSLTQFAEMNNELSSEISTMQTRSRKLQAELDQARAELAELRSQLAPAAEVAKGKSKGKSK